MVEQSLIRRQSGQWLATHNFGPYLDWRAVGLGLIRSIGWSCQALASIYFIPTVQQVPNPYLLVARRWWLRVNCVENRNLARNLATARNPTLNSSILVAYSPSRMGYPLGSFPVQVGLRGGCWSGGLVKNIQHIWRLQTKNLNETSQNQTENEAADFPIFIVIESLEEVCLAKFSPFPIEKVLSTRASPKTFKKTRNGNLLVEVDSRRQAENISKIKTFHTTKCRAYPHEKLNSSKGVIRSRELALATEDEIASALGKRSYKYKENLQKKWTTNPDQHLHPNIK